VKKILISEVLLAAFCLIFASATKADTQNIQLGCVSVTCVSNGSILTTQTLTGAQLDLTGNSNAAGELFIAIYVPVSTGGGVGNFIGPNSLEVWSVLEPGVTPGNDHSYGSTLGNDPFANSVTGFVVSDFDTGINFASGCLTSVCTSPTFTVPGNFPVGALFVGFTEDSKGNVVASTPWSESVLAVPEPSSLSMLGIGLVGLLALTGRKLITP